MIAVPGVMWANLFVDILVIFQSGQPIVLDVIDCFQEQKPKDSGTDVPPEDTPAKGQTDGQQADCLDHRKPDHFVLPAYHGLPRFPQPLLLEIPGIQVAVHHRS